MVERLEDYPWSSYAASVAQTAAPSWLHREMVYSMLGGKTKRYQAFVAQGVDEDLAQFYQGESVSPILGDESFKQQIIERHGSDEPEIAERSGQMTYREIAEALGMTTTALWLPVFDI